MSFHTVVHWKPKGVITMFSFVTIQDTCNPSARVIVLLDSWVPQAIKSHSKDVVSENVIEGSSFETIMEFMLVTCIFCQVISCHSEWWMCWIQFHRPWRTSLLFVIYFMYEVYLRQINKYANRMWNFTRVLKTVPLIYSWILLPLVFIVL